MKKDETSGIIRGPKERFRIIKLIGRREDLDMNLEESRPIIREILKKKKIEELSIQWQKQLRNEAAIIYYDPVEKAKEPPLEH